MEVRLWRHGNVASFSEASGWGWHEDAALVTEGERLLWLGADRALPAPLAARAVDEIDLGGACVTPGLIATDINKGKIPDDKRQGILDGIPLARIGEPADVAGCVVFLASDLAKYCTGVTLDVNGGMLIH